MDLKNLWVQLKNLERLIENVEYILLINKIHEF